MQLMITKPALEWYKREMELANGDYVRFFARYGGSSPLQKGFSLGMSMDMPKEPEVQVKNEGITFFIEREDLWYFDKHNLTVIYNDTIDEIEFQYN
ncbi:HesB/YadR/YfhF family protein [Bacillus sp. Marseille-P3661]|uniref:HesB/YadR/YfhF family protein n=1 Tax=Bacillus sp. Marseille-P3661 TaxID=1936234 RepID=UPI000C8522B7|nr:HesB/YadR/YfhF family protein [Bacillus sp. Marseille-P3661]